MLYILTGVLTIATLALLGRCLRIKKELEITKKLRNGYERKFNTFKLKYTFLSKLENESLVLKNIKKIPQPLYIYGGGVVGDKFLKILQKGDIKVERVIEGRELAENPDYGKTLNTQRYIIVTPMFDYENIAVLLQKYFEREKIIGLDEIVN